MTEYRVVADVRGELSPQSAPLHSQDAIDRAIKRVETANRRTSWGSGRGIYRNIRVQEREVSEWRDRR